MTREATLERQVERLMPREAVEATLGRSGFQDLVAAQTQLDGAPPQFWVSSCAEGLQLHLSRVFSWVQFARSWRDFCQKRCDRATTSDDDVVR